MKFPGATDTGEGGLEGLIVAAMTGEAATTPTTTDNLSGPG